MHRVGKTKLSLTASMGFKLEGSSLVNLIRDGLN